MAESDQPRLERPVARKIRLSKKKKVAFAVITCVIALICVEVVLAAIGVKPLKHARDPFEGRDAGVPLFVRQGDAFVTNEPKLTYFNPQSFPAAKAPNAYRVFCLGGSTTFGRPYDDRTSYVGWLRELLRDADPQRQWQIVNCGGISYASYRLALLTDELVRYQPDMIIVYTGHNEFLEERTFRAVSERSHLMQSLYGVASQSRMATILDRLVEQPTRAKSSTPRFPEEVTAILDQSQGPQSYTRDLALRDNVSRQFRDSLTHICLVAERAGAKVLLIKPAANLSSFSPFKSEHGAISSADKSACDQLLAEGQDCLAKEDYAEAATLFEAAIRLDPLFSLSHYLAGTACLKLQRFDEAREHFRRAKDEDICPLRAPTAIQDTMSDVASDRRVPLIDFPRYLEERSAARREHRLVGEHDFLDHVHPTIDAHLELALLIVTELANQEVIPPPGNPSALRARVSGRVLAGLDATSHALALCNLAQVLSWAGKDTEALPLAERAHQQLPKSSYVACQYGRLLEKNGQVEAAFEQYRDAALLDPQDAQALSRFGGALLQRKSYEDALAVLQLAAKYTPERAPKAFRISLHAKLGDCLKSLGQDAEARSQYQQAERLQSR